MTWDKMKVKYPECRDEMSIEREREFVRDCFDCYEEEGFSGKFWSPGGDFPEYVGKPFTVIGRIEEYDAQNSDGADLECLPMWQICFRDGKIIPAYPAEIIPCEMRDNGCPASFWGGKI